MRISKVDGEIERRIVTGMIVSTAFLRDVKDIYVLDLLASTYTRTLAGWCLDYFDRYGEAPGRHIADIYDDKLRQGLTGDGADLLADLLAGLSADYEHAEAGQFNARYLFDETAKYFEARNQELLVADVQALHGRGDFDEAAALIHGYKRVQAAPIVGVEPLANADVIARAYADGDGDVLFRLPGAMGELLGPVEREDFIGILAPEKRGKSWRLLDIAVRALRAGCNVAYFDAGDMSQDQIVRRLCTRVSSRSHKYWGEMLAPVLDCRHSQEDTCRRRERVSRCGCLEEVERGGKIVRIKMVFNDANGYIPCSVCARDNPREFRGAVWYERIVAERLTTAAAVEIGGRVAARSRKRLKLSCHPNSTLTVAAMDAQLDRWEREDGFVADLVCADYFDIFDAEAGSERKDERHIHDARWRAGRRLTQTRHCALITPTQADAASYDQKSLKLKNFSEAKIKYAHCTKFWALNQTADEKREMIIRMATLIAREDDFDIDREVAIMQNLRLGQPYIGSFWV